MQKKSDANGSGNDEGDVKAGVALLGRMAKKHSQFQLRKSVVILVFVAALAVALGIFIGPTLKAMLSPQEEIPPVTVLDNLTESEKADIIQDKTVEIKSIVIGESRERRELLVLEQDVETDSVWESAWGGLEVFKKSKRIVSYGTGYFNVDLSRVDESCIEVDPETLVVTVTIPRAVLKSISIDESKTQYEDTQRGLLSFGELKLTAEQQGLLKESALKSMREKLETEEILLEADHAARTAVREIYQPLLAAVSQDYIVAVRVRDSQ